MTTSQSVITMLRGMAQWLAGDRQKAYDDFLRVARGQAEYEMKVIQVKLMLRVGEADEAEEAQKALPAPMMQEFTDALHRIMKLARNYSVIAAAEELERLIWYMERLPTAVEDAVEDNEGGSNFSIGWLVLTVVLNGRIDQFTSAYREDLGLGSPNGAPKHWPFPKYSQGTAAVALDELQRRMNELFAIQSEVRGESPKPNAEP